VASADTRTIIPFEQVCQSDLTIADGGLRNQIVYTYVNETQFITQPDFRSGNMDQKCVSAFELDTKTFAW